MAPAAYPHLRRSGSAWVRFHEVRARVGPQSRPGGSRGAVSLDRQRLPRLLDACTYCFARPDPRVPRHEHRARLRARDRGQGQRRRSCSAPSSAAVVGARAGRLRHQHRSLPVGRGPLQADAADDRGAGRRRHARLDPDQVPAGDARPRPAQGRVAQGRDVSVNFSVPTLEEKAWRETEPHTPHPRKRLEAVRRAEPRRAPLGVRSRR